MNIIIGAGPTGISTAYHLKKANKPFLIIEKEKQIGGLCRSFELGGTIFDYGDHIFYTQENIYVKNLIKALFKQQNQNFNDQERSAWVYAFNTFSAFPFQSNLCSFPTDIIKHCIMGLIDIKELTKHPSNILEWIEFTFGKGILDSFMEPYNKKVWAHPLEDIEANWAGDRIIKPNYEEIIDGALECPVKTPYPSSKFAYPEKGGFQEIIHIMAKDLNLKENLILGSVIEVDPVKKRVKTDTGKEFTYNNLISTMPLNELTQQAKGIEAHLFEEAKKLNSFDLYIVSLVTSRTNFTDKQHVYCADEDVPWHRLGIHSNLSHYLKNLPTFGVQAEVSFSKYKPVEKEGLIDKVFDSLVKMKIFKSDEPIIATDIRTISPAYIVYTKGCKEAAEKLVRYFEKKDILCAGRWGEWAYFNLDTVIMRGKEVAEKC